MRERSESYPDLLSRDVPLSRTVDDEDTFAGWVEREVGPCS